jgi:hypothetical protein
MRCDEVMRELSLPSDDRDDGALADHLAECEACALWSEHAARLNRLWDATRPIEPPTESWDRLWSSVTARLDHAGSVTTPHSQRDHSYAVVGDAAPRHLSPLSRSWRSLAAIGLIGLAQAAALLLAVSLYWNTGSNSSLDSVVDVEWGQVPLIHSDGFKVEITDLALLEPSSGEDPWYDLFNRAESASTVVAMTE